MKKASMMFVAIACMTYSAMVIASGWFMLHASPATQAILAPMLTAMMGGGFLKLLNIFQNRETDRKVTEDVNTSKQIKHMVNGGLEDRIARAVHAAMRARDAGVPIDDVLPPKPADPSPPADPPEKKDAP